MSYYLNDLENKIMIILIIVILFIWLNKKNFKTKNTINVVII